MIRFCTLGSGSKGNSIFVEVDKRKFLIDAGFPREVLSNKLSSIGKSLDDIKAVFFTHAHTDHFQEWAGNIGCSGVPNTRVRWFHLSHDTPCFGYTIKDNDNNKIAILTDTGCVSEEALGHMFDCQAILIECGYDVDMLVNGPYPTELQERIASDVGHLMNEDAAAVVKMVSWPGLKYIVALHLSEHNNDPELVKFCLESVNASGAEVIIAQQHEVGRMVTLI